MAKDWGFILQGYIRVDIYKKKTENRIQETEYRRQNTGDRIQETEEGTLSGRPSVVSGH